MSLGMHFDSFGSLCAPVPGLLVSLALILNWDRMSWTSLWYLMDISPALKSLIRVSLFLIYPFPGGLVPPPPLCEVPFRFPWSSVLWGTHWTFPVWCSLHHQYSFPYFFSCSTFWIFQNPGWYVPGVGLLSISGITVGGVGFIRLFLRVIFYLLGHS